MRTNNKWILSIIIGSILFCSCSKESTSNVNQDKVISVENLKTIEYCRLNYNKDIMAVQNGAYSHINFGDAEFALFPNCEKVGKYNVEYPDISVEESIDIINAWIQENGFEVDLNNELFAATDHFPGENGMPYPLVMNHVNDFDNGNSFFIDTNQCHIQMGGANIYSMSNGVISSYVNSDMATGLDAMGVYSEVIVAEGSVEELYDASYVLLNGEITIGEAAENVKDFFENGTPYLGPEGIEIEVPYVRIFSLGEIYGYEFNVRRVYNGVPFAFGDFGVYRENDAKQITLDVKMAYTITGNVDAYTGFSNNCSFIPIVEEQARVIPLIDACSILDEYVGNQMSIDIQNVEFVYCVISDESTGIETAYPCWSLKGYNSTDGRTYTFYIDVLDGNVFYHSYVE